MAGHREREVVTEFLELYSNFPCLWDIGSDQYKDRNRKIQAWESLAKKLREIEPSANVASAKKKICHMRISYQREEKKIKESKKPGSGTSGVHTPILWYFNLLRPVFESKDELSRVGEDTFASDKDPKPCQTEKNSGAIKKNTSRRSEKKNRKLIKTTQELLHIRDKKLNSFGVYVGEQLDQIDTSQRQVAEKLISDVLFLAKTGNLCFDTKIETPTRTSPLFASSHSVSQSRSPSPQYIVPSSLSSGSPPPSYIRPSPLHSKYSNTPSPPPTQLHSQKFIPPRYTSQMSTTEQDENIIQISLPNDTSLHSCTLTKKKHTSTTTSTSSYDSPSPILQYIVSSSHVIQSSPRTCSSSQIVTNANEENAQPTLAESEPSLYTVPTKENQTTTTVHEGPAKSLLAELLES